MVNYCILLASMFMNKRNIKVDTLRGLACILLVAFHVIGSDASNGLRVDTGWYREINDTFAYIRMPLFTFISGVVYAYRPFNGDFGRFLSGKFKRVLVPMLTLGTLFAIVQSATPGTNGGDFNWKLLHIIPVAHFWFVEAIFIIFAIVSVLEYLRLLSKPVTFFLVFLAAAAVFLSHVTISYFSLQGVAYLMPYFLTGLAVQRFGILSKIPPLMGGVMALAVVLYLVSIMLGYFELEGRLSLQALICGMVFCVGALTLGAENTALARIGYFSFTIYLLHVFFTSAVRILMHKLGIYNLDLVFLLALFAGVFGPIIAELVLDGTNVTRQYLLGKRKVEQQQLWFSSRFLSKS